MAYATNKILNSIIDKVGYGMRYESTGKEEIAVLSIGYGDGYPRVRNQGHVLIHGRQAPIVGGISMDAMTVVISSIPEAKVGDEVVLLGQQGSEQITANDIAGLKGSVSYDILANWRWRLPRLYAGKNHSPRRFKKRGLLTSRTCLDYTVISMKPSNKSTL